MNGFDVAATASFLRKNIEGFETFLEESPGSKSGALSIIEDIETAADLMMLSRDGVPIAEEE